MAYVHLANFEQALSVIDDFQKLRKHKYRDVRLMRLLLVQCLLHTKSGLMRTYLCYFRMLSHCSRLTDPSLHLCDLAESVFRFLDRLQQRHISDAAAMHDIFTYNSKYEDAFLILRRCIRELEHDLPMVVSSMLKVAAVYLSQKPASAFTIAVVCKVILLSAY